MTARSGGPPDRDRRNPESPLGAPPDTKAADEDDNASFAYGPSTYGLSVDELLAEASRLIDNGWSAEEIRQVLAFDGES